MTVRGADIRARADAPKLLTMKEAARELRRSKRTVERRIASGALSSIREGKNVFVLSDDLRAYIATRHQEAASAHTVAPSAFPGSETRTVRSPGRARLDFLGELEAVGR